MVGKRKVASQMLAILELSNAWLGWVEANVSTAVSNLQFSVGK